jgi:hypothetical protein
VLLYLALWIFFWFRPHYGFVGLCVVVMLIIDAISIVLGIGGVAVVEPAALLDLEGWLTLPIVYVQYHWRGFALFAGVGIMIVAFRKWMKARNTGGDNSLDKGTEEIRAESAARDNPP